jgi:hypothetical protein
VAAALLLSSCDSLSGCGCDKEDETEPVSAAPPPGGGPADVLPTDVGNGLGLPTHLAPTSAKWEQVVVVDENTAIVAGRSLDEAIALRTTDGGKNWTSLRSDGDQWSRWGVGDDGAVVLASGKLGKSAGSDKPIVEGRIQFAPLDEPLSEPTKFFPGEGPLSGASIADGSATPVALDSESTTAVGALARSGRSTRISTGASSKSW